MRYQRLWALAIIVTLAAWLSASAIAAPGAAGIVTTASGQITIRRKGMAAFATLARGNAFNIGDIVATGSTGKATLLFSDGSHVKLNSNTAIQITPLTTVGNGHQSLFRALSGEMWARLRQGRAVQTRTAIAGVRGTEINIKVDDDGTSTLTVLEGEVDFSNEFGAVLVNQSQQSVARPGAAPTAPVTINNAGLIIEWTIDLNRAVIPRERFYVSLNRAALAGELQQRGTRAHNAPNDAAAQREYGDVLFDNHQYMDALHEYEAANRLEPRLPATLTRIGYTQLELDHLDAATASFQAALKPTTQTVSFRPASFTFSGITSALGNWVKAQRTQATDATYAPALVGLSWVALTHDAPDQAQQFAEQAAAAANNNAKVRPTATGTPSDEDAVEPYVTLGLSLMRQPGKTPEAVQAFQTATKLQPAAYRYQAHAWLGLIYQAEGDQDAALREAQTANKLEPYSALAHGNASLVYFFNGKPEQAVREARLATQLNPQSVAARVALGQSLLARGDVDAAADAAAQAVALDPKLPQAQYLLGVANADRRDYVHATRVLQESLRLAPSFLPAANVLARVYTRTGHPQQAVTLLTDLMPRYPHSNEVQAALGEVYYEQGRYTDAVTQYQNAIKQKPNSALYYAGLSKTLLDSNRLSSAIDAGQQAVRLAPQVAQYHAILGQAYDFSRLSSQSEREYRTAITLDPQNALARAMLGLKATDPATTVDTFSQAFLFDPAISTQVLRGGIGTELSPSGGSDRQRGVNLLHRDIANDGKLHFLGGYGRNEDAGNPNRVNDKTSTSNFRQDTTYTLGPQTNIYFNLVRARNNQGLSSLASSPFGPDPDANSAFGFDQGELSLRHRLRQGHYLWLGFTYQRQSTDLTNGAQPFPLPFPLPINTAFPYTNENFRNRALIPEFRADFNLNRTAERSSILTLGLAHANLKPTITTGPLAIFNNANPAIAPQLLPPSTSNGKENLSVGYAQLTQRLGNRLSLAAQLRAQRDNITTVATGGQVGPGLSLTTTTHESHLLPSLLTTYQMDQKTTLRLLFNERAGTTNLAFAPTETRLTVEPDILARGVPRRAQILELDAERYLPHNAFLKMYLFHATANDVGLGEDAPVYAFRTQAPLILGKLQQNGIGMRYEQPLTRNLFGQVGLLFSNSHNRTVGQPFNLGQAPYYPRNAFDASLNYVDARGNKVTLVGNYFGSYFADRPNLFGLPADVQRPRFPSHVYFTLLLAKEPSVHNELFLGISNLFNAPSITFNDVPTISDAFGTGRRRVFAGVTRRY
ncbi:MAG: tetratricopeptide repeat protein [Abitibacteriaceae bacterium]|nr:tetratricopeptide repeat protein [Abditibacteriaceae bacterium]